MTLTEAEDAYDDARASLRYVRDVIESEKQAIRFRYENLIAAECEAVDRTYGGVLADAVKRERECQQLRDELKVASMKEATLGGVPVGGRVCKWKRKWRFDPMTKTDEVGIVEVCTADSRFPSNQNYSLPSVGQLFIRILKKDGTPSLRFVNGWTFGGGLPYNWYPEGVEPK